MPTDTVAAMAATPAIRESLPFTLLGSPCSVRVQVRVSLLGSAFGVRRSSFAVRGVAVRGSSVHQTAGATPRGEPNLEANLEREREPRSENREV